MASESKPESPWARLGTAVYLLLVLVPLLGVLAWGAATIPESVRDGVTLESGGYHEVTGSLERRRERAGRYRTSYWHLATSEGSTQEMQTLRNTSLRAYVGDPATGYVDDDGRLLAIEPQGGHVVRAAQVGKEAIGLRFLIALPAVLVASTLLTHAFRRRGRPWLDWRLATGLVLACPLGGLVWAHVQDLDAMLIADRLLVPFTLGTAAFLGLLAWALHVAEASMPKRQQTGAVPPYDQAT